MPKFTVINVFPHRVESHWDYGKFGIDAAENGNYGKSSYEDQMFPDGYGVAFTKVAAGWDQEKGEPKFFNKPVSAKEVVDNLVREHSFKGVAQIAGDEPTDEELAEANNALTALYIEHLRDADRLWVRYNQQPAMITDMHREAAKHLRKIGHSMMAESRKWLEITMGVGAALADCPACGEQIKKDVVKCKHCGAILDKEKAVEFGLIQPPPPPRKPHGGPKIGRFLKEEREEE